MSFNVISLEDYKNSSIDKNVTLVPILNVAESLSHNFSAVSGMQEVQDLLIFYLVDRKITLKYLQRKNSFKLSIEMSQYISE